MLRKQMISIIIKMCKDYNLKKIQEILKTYGISGLVDSVILYGISILRDKLYKWTRDDYGLKEVFFFPKGVDVYLRYSIIVNELNRMININSSNRRKIRVLEVGAGGDGIARFLKYSRNLEKFEVVLIDIDKRKLEGVRLGQPIVADGCNLPFRDNSFDVVVSVDVLEHIPKEMRQKFLGELKRVCRRMVMLHFILHDPGKGFLGRDADLKFQEWYMKTFRRPELNTAEHISAGHPNLGEILKVFPNSQIVGTQNVDVWFKYMTYSTKPIVGFLTGLIYYFKWKKLDKKYPFHACFLKWVKEG